MKELKHTEIKSEVFTTEGMVNYVARFGDYRHTDMEYEGTLAVFRTLLNYDYLWMNVRVKNGAYGCMNSFGKSGDSFFVSYRDPKLKQTMETFEKTGDYLRKFNIDDRTMTKYIIGAISDMDVPMTPSTKGSRSLGAYLTNLEFEDIQRERDELLSCEQKDIRALAEYIDAIMEENAVCVVGNGQAIEENKEMFGKIENLFR